MQLDHRRRDTRERGRSSGNLARTPKNNRRSLPVSLRPVRSGIRLLFPPTLNRRSLVALAVLLTCLTELRLRESLG